MRKSSHRSGNRGRQGSTGETVGRLRLIEQDSILGKYAATAFVIRKSAAGDGVSWGVCRVGGNWRDKALLRRHLQFLGDFGSRWFRWGRWRRHRVLTP